MKTKGLSEETIALKSLSRISKKMGKTVEEVYQDLKNMIYLGLLAPGQKIIYRDLAIKLNVSTTPVVQALKRLERSNLVTYEPNKGYSIGELTINMVEELFQVREVLEVYSIPLLINNLDRKNIKAIRDAFKEYSVAVGPEKGRTLMLRDAQFHLKMIEFSGNNTIYGFLKEVLEQIYLRWKPEYLQKSRIDEALKEHKDILNALGKGDTEETMVLLKEHIRKGREHIIGSLQMRNNIFKMNRGMGLEILNGPPFR